jgi:mono/diheme cytochrome c family protein
MKKNKYLLLASSAGVLLLLLFAAVQENFLKEWRRIQATAHNDEGSVPVQLRQVVNNNLGVADRCVSCHVSMAPGENSVRGHKVLTAHKPVVHDPAEYGCTVCHAGQGQATEKADAHGDVHFWPEPMLPANFSYAGCGRCHSALGVPQRELLGQAVLAFERLDCRSCHRVDGRGGTVRPDGGGMEGPDLSRAGLTGYDTAWHDKHVAKAQSPTENRAWKISFAPVSAADLPLMEMYLKTRVAAPQLVAAKSEFFSSGCLGCHKVSGVGGDDGPDLSRAGDKDPGQASFAAVPGKASVDNWLAEHFRAPASVVVGSQMPPVNLSREEIDRLTMYTMSLRRRELRDVYLPKDRIRAVKFGEREFSADGATLYGAFCAGCHGRDGMGRRLPGLVSFPSIANPDFLARVTDDFIAHTVQHGRPGRRMPGWTKDGGLRPDEIRAVVAYVRELGRTAPVPESQPARWIKADAAHGKRVFESTCGGCHGMQGTGGEGPALNNKVLLESATDTYLVETIGRGRRGTVMAGFSEPSPVRPALAPADIQAVIAYLRSLQGGKS